MLEKLREIKSVHLYLGIAILLTIPCYCVGIMLYWNNIERGPTSNPTLTETVSTISAQTITPSFTHPSIITQSATTTATITPTFTATRTYVLPPTDTPTPTLTPTITSTFTSSPTATDTLTPTQSETATETPTETPEKTVENIE